MLSDVVNSSYLMDTSHMTSGTHFLKNQLNIDLSSEFIVSSLCIHGKLDNCRKCKEYYAYIISEFTNSFDGIQCPPQLLVSLPKIGKTG